MCKYVSWDQNSMLVPIIIIIMEQSVGQWGAKASIRGSPRLGSSLNVPSAREALATRMHPTWRAWNKSFVRGRRKFQSSSWHSPPRANTWVCKLNVHIIMLHIFLPRFRRSLLTGANINFKVVIGIIFGRHPISIFILLPTELQTEQWAGCF